MSQKVLDRIAEKFPDFLVSTHSLRGDDTLIIRREGVLPILTHLRDDPDMDFNMLVDVCGVDMHGFPGHTGPRLVCVYHLYSLTHKHRVRVKVPLELDDPTVDSVSHLWGSANWGERETWDMYGIKFRNSPDHRRMLLYEEFEGHPLRKDYPQRGYQPLVAMPALPRADREYPPLVDEDL
jgi:NADH-quinone oxidoreductase subunit C